MQRATILSYICSFVQDLFLAAWACFSGELRLAEWLTLDAVFAEKSISREEAVQALGHRPCAIYSKLKSTGFATTSGVQRKFSIPLGAKIGDGLFVDHGTGVSIGERPFSARADETSLMAETK